MPHDERSDWKGPWSPVGGRSESPSQSADAGEQAAESRAGAAGERSEFTLDADATPASLGGGDGDAGRATAGRAPVGGREDEPEHSPAAPVRRPKVRMLRLYLPVETAEELEAAVAASGLSRASFVCTSMVVGFRLLSRVSQAENILIQGAGPVRFGV